MNTTNILLNSSNVVAGSDNSKYEYKFPVPKLMNNSSIALHSLQLYYSWFNINAALYNNNTFVYKWWNSNRVLKNFTVTIPDGFYTIETLNLYVQSEFLKNGHYLYDTIEKKNIFYIEFISNATYYSIQLNILPMYATGTKPSHITKQNTWALPDNQETPIVIIPSTGNFKDLLGFTPASYPPTTQNTLYQHLSDYTPQLSPVSSVIMRCNLVQNDYALPNDVLYSFTSGTAGFGDIINEKPNELYFSKIPNGSFNSIQISFYDQNFNSMHILDPQLLITLLIKEEKN